MLGVILALKLAFGGLLVAAHQRFLQNKGLVLLFATSLVLQLVLSFLHGLVPHVVISIADALWAIVVAIVAVVWAVVFLIGAIVGVVNALRVARRRPDVMPSGTADEHHAGRERRAAGEADRAGAAPEPEVDVVAWVHALAKVQALHLRGHGGRTGRGTQHEATSLAREGQPTSLGHVEAAGAPPP